MDRRRFNKQVKWKEQDVTHTQANFGEALLTLVASNIFVTRMCLIDIEIYTTYLLCTANFARPVNLSNDYLSSRDLATLTHSSLIVLLSLERSIYLFSFRSKEPKFQSISKLTRSKNNWLEIQQDRKLSKIPLIFTIYNLTDAKILPMTNRYFDRKKIKKYFNDRWNVNDIDGARGKVGISRCTRIQGERGGRYRSKGESIARAG